MSSLSTAPNDVIFFYYTGHGFNDGSKNDYPTFTLVKDGEEMSRRKMELLDVYNTLRGKNHRLLVVMAEARKKQSSGSSIADNSPFEEDESKYKTLFSATGDYMISSSKKGQASFSQAGSMGAFSRSFADAVSELLAKDSKESLNWPALFKLISQKTVQRAEQMKIEQNPQWLQGAYSAGASTVYKSAKPVTTTTTTTTSTVSTPSRKSYYREPWNSPDEPKIIGLSLGYVTKQWAASYDGQVDKFGYWEDKEYLTGIQVGIRVEPQFKYGFALNTGLYYEYYFSNTDNTTINDEYNRPLSCSGGLEEHNLYLPIHLEYRLHFSDNFNVFFFGGVGLDYGLGGTVKYKDIPGYEDKVIMAGGTFVEGSTIELSADGPMREPYVAYMQGGLNYAHIKICLEEMVKNL